MRDTINSPTSQLCLELRKFNVWSGKHRNLTPDDSNPQRPCLQDRALKRYHFVIWTLNRTVLRAVSLSKNVSAGRWSTHSFSTSIVSFMGFPKPLGFGILLRPDLEQRHDKVRVDDKPIGVLSTQNGSVRSLLSRTKNGIQPFTDEAQV